MPKLNRKQRTIKTIAKRIKEEMDKERDEEDIEGASVFLYDIIALVIRSESK